MAVAVSSLLSFASANLSHSKSCMLCWCLLKYSNEIPSVFSTTSPIQGCGVMGLEPIPAVRSEKCSERDRHLGFKTGVHKSVSFYIQSMLTTNIFYHKCGQNRVLCNVKSFLVP